MDAILREPMATQTAIQQLIDRHFEEFKGSLAKDFASKFEGQGQQLVAANRDLAVFKNAHFEEQQRNKALTDQLKTIEDREKRVVVLIDGDGAIFLPSLITDGKQGGHEAASRLTTGIKAHLGPQQFKLHVYVFLNRRGLTLALKRHGHTEAAVMFDEFVVGFNQAAERFAIIDAGELKEGSDHKIRAYLDDNIYSSQTLKVFFGGCHDNGYVTTLNSYITSGHKEKLILLPGYTDTAGEIEKLGIPSLRIPLLFLAEKLTLPTLQHAADRNGTLTPPISPPGLVHPSSAFVRPTVGSYKSAVQSKSPVDDSYPKWTMSSVRTSAGSSYADSFDAYITGANGRGLRKTNPRLVELIELFVMEVKLTTQPPYGASVRYFSPFRSDPPPCILHYLAKCRFGSECQWGHDYDLTEDEMDTLRANAKKNPCATILNGDECTWGSHCIYGHVCPNAPRCHYNTAGICKFSGRGMHTVA